MPKQLNMDSILPTRNVNTRQIEIYCDGACSGNPGKGAWAAIILEGNQIIHQCSGFVPTTTNNQMELKAAIEGLKSIAYDNEQITVYTDSEYVQKGITKWIYNWLRSNWNNGKVKNVALWQELYSLSINKNITWLWVRGHAGNHYNEMVDSIAQKTIKDNVNIGF